MGYSGASARRNSATAASPAAGRKSHDTEAAARQHAIGFVWQAAAGNRGSGHLRGRQGG